MPDATGLCNASSDTTGHTNCITRSSRHPTLARRQALGQHQCGAQPLLSESMNGFALVKLLRDYRGAIVVSVTSSYPLAR